MELKSNKRKTQTGDMISQRPKTPQGVKTATNSGFIDKSQLGRLTEQEQVQFLNRKLSKERVLYLIRSYFLTKKLTEAVQLKLLEVLKHRKPKDKLAKDQETKEYQARDDVFYYIIRDGFYLFTEPVQRWLVTESRKSPRLLGVLEEALLQNFHLLSDPLKKKLFNLKRNDWKSSPVNTRESVVTPKASTETESYERKLERTRKLKCTLSSLSAPSLAQTVIDHYIELPETIQLWLIDEEMTNKEKILTYIIQSYLLTDRLTEDVKINLLIRRYSTDHMTDDDEEDWHAVLYYIIKNSFNLLSEKVQKQLMLNSCHTDQYTDLICEFIRTRFHLLSESIRNLLIFKGLENELRRGNVHIESVDLWVT
jgi:predicted DNA-binding protein (MmcQ/YjbR family)